MSRVFERLGYVVSAPTAWLSHEEKVSRYMVGCAPMRDVLALIGVKRIDVFWLDVEGAELAGYCYLVGCEFRKSDLMCVSARATLKSHGRSGFAMTCLRL